jgi:hypothetical protein
MNRLTRLHDSRGLHAFRRHRDAVKTQDTDKGWWLWPWALFLFACGVAGLVWCVYNGWLDGVFFMLFWLSGIAYFGWCARPAWRRRRAARAGREQEE